MDKIAAQYFLVVWDEILEWERETDHSLCKRLGITPSTVSHWRKGLSKCVRPSTIKLLETKLGYVLTRSERTGQWNITQKPVQKKELSEAGPRGTKDLKTYPIATAITATEGGHACKISGERSAPLSINDERAFWYEIRDESMEPRFSKGDLVLVSPGTVARNGEYAFVIQKQDPDPIVRKFFVRGDHVALVPLNPSFDVIPVGKDEIALCGRVVFCRIAPPPDSSS